MFMITQRSNFHLCRFYFHLFNVSRLQSIWREVIFIFVWLYKLFHSEKNLLMIWMIYSYHKNFKKIPPCSSSHLYMYMKVRLWLLFILQTNHVNFLIFFFYLAIHHENPLTLFNVFIIFGDMNILQFIQSFPCC